MTAAGNRRELARYQLAEGTRAVVAQRIEGYGQDTPETRNGRVR